MSIRLIDVQLLLELHVSGPPVTDIYSFTKDRIYLPNLCLRLFGQVLGRHEIIKTKVSLMVEEPIWEESYWPTLGSLTEETVMRVRKYILLIVDNGLYIYMMTCNVALPRLRNKAKKDIRFSRHKKHLAKGDTHPNLTQWWLKFMQSRFLTLNLMGRFKSLDKIEETNCIKNIICLWRHVGLLSVIIYLSSFKFVVLGPKMQKVNNRGTNIIF